MPVRSRSRLPGVMVATGTTVSITLASGLFGVISARALGPYQRGLLATATVWTAVLGSIVVVGVPQAVTFHVARAPDRAPRFATTSVLLAAALGTLLAAPGVVAALLLARPGAAVAMALLFVGCVPSFIAGCGIAAILGSGAIRMWAVLRAANPVAALMTLAFVVLAGGSTAVVVACVTTAISILQAGAVVIALRRRGLLGAGGRREARALLHYGGRQALSGAAWLLNYKLDQLVLTAAVAPAALGLYAVASSFGELLAPVAASAGSLMLARAAAGGSLAARQALPTAVVLCCVLVFVGAGLVALFPRDFLEVLFGSSFAGAAGILRVLLIGTIGLSLGSVLSDTLRGLNHPLDPAKAELAGAVVTATLLFALVPSHGIWGAAVATAISYNLVMVGLVFIVRGRLRQSAEALALRG